MNPLASRRERQGVDFARFVFAVRHDRGRLIRDRPIGDDTLLGFVVLQGPHSAGDVVGVEVVAFEFREFLAAVDMAAGDRLAAVVVVFPDRLGQFRHGPSAVDVVRVLRLASAPAVVAAFFEQIDFFPEILADVGKPALAGLAVEGHPPRVTTTQREDFRASAGLVHEGVVLRDRVAFAVGLVVDVQSKNLA